MTLSSGSTMLNNEQHPSPSHSSCPSSPDNGTEDDDEAPARVLHTHRAHCTHPLLNSVRDFHCEHPLCHRHFDHSRWPSQTDWCSNRFNLRDDDSCEHHHHPRHFGVFRDPTYLCTWHLYNRQDDLLTFDCSLSRILTDSCKLNRFSITSPLLLQPLWSLLLVVMVLYSSTCCAPSLLLGAMIVCNIRRIVAWSTSVLCSMTTTLFHPRSAFAPSRSPHSSSPLTESRRVGHTTSSPISLASVFMWTKVCLFVLLVAMFAITPTASASMGKASALRSLHGKGSTNLSYFEEPDPNIYFSHMAINAYTGNVYVGAVNTIYQLNSQLKLENLRKMGPLESFDCQPGKRCPPLHYYNKVLVIDYAASRLISCGSLYQGACMTHRLDNVSHVIVQPAESVAANNATASTVAFIAPGPQSHKQVLYVGATYTKDNYRTDVYAIASRSLSDNCELTMMLVLSHHNHVPFFQLYSKWPHWVCPRAPDWWSTRWPENGIQSITFTASSRVDSRTF